MDSDTDQNTAPATDPAKDTAPAQNEPAARQPAEPAADPAKDTAPAQNEPAAQPQGDKPAAEEQAADPTSAAAKMLGLGKDDGEEPAKEEPAADTMPETDEDWTSAAIGDTEDETIRTFASALAPKMREQGITPKQYSKVAEIVCEKLVADEKEARAQRAAHAEELSVAAQKKFNEKEWQDISTGIRDYVPKDSDLYRALSTTELGSDINLLTILKKVGETSREDTPPSDRAGGAGSEMSLESRLFRRSFPNS